jgi:hypothetical protein
MHNNNGWCRIHQRNKLKEIMVCTEKQLPSKPEVPAAPTASSVSAIGQDFYDDFEPVVKVDTEETPPWEQKPKENTWLKRFQAHIASAESATEHIGITPGSFELAQAHAAIANAIAASGLIDKE